MKRLELLDANHNRNNFDCGSEALNQYLQRTARQHNQKGISRTFVLVDTERPQIVIGFFTLALCEISTRILPSKWAKKYPTIVAGVKLARLAVDKSYQLDILSVVNDEDSYHSVESRWVDGSTQTATTVV